jgi:hypothetical protein
MYSSLGSRSVVAYHLYTVELTCTRCPGICPTPLSIVDCILAQPTSVYTRVIIVSSQQA